MPSPVVIPCIRPKVTVDPRTDPPTAVGTVIATCHVPGCRWTYPDDLKFHALKSDAADQATMHRAQHRDAVPSTNVESSDGLWDVYCAPCGGHRRSLPTRREAQTWLDRHLVQEHGLVVCP